MAAYAKQKALVIRGAADAADISRVLLELRDVAAIFGPGCKRGQGQRGLRR